MSNYVRVVSVEFRNGAKCVLFVAIYEMGYDNGTDRQLK